MIAKRQSRFHDKGLEQELDNVVRLFNDLDRRITELKKFTSSEIKWKDISNPPTSYEPNEHDHDERYYTEEETDSFLASMNSDIENHTQSDETVTNTSNLLGSNVKEVFNNIHLKGLNTEDVIFTSAKNLDIDAGEEVVDIFPITEAKTCKWLIHVTDRTNGTLYTCEMLAQYDGLQVRNVEYAVIGSSAVDFIVDFLDGYVRLLARAAADNQSVIVIRTSIKAI